MKFILTLFICSFVAPSLFAQTDSIGNCEAKFQAWKQQELEKQHSEFVGQVELFPEILMSVAPVYPDSAKKYGIEGDLVVWFIVDTIGRPQCAIILHKIGNGMDEAALLAIQEWRFKPVIVNGKKQISPMTMPFRFQINNKKKSRAG